MTSRSNKSIINTALFLLLLILFSGNIGSFSKELNILIGSSILFAFFFLSLPVSLKRISRSVYCIAFIFFVLLLINLKIDSTQFLIVLIVCLVMLLHLSSFFKQNTFELRTQLFSAIIYTTFIFLYEYSSITWYLLQYISLCISITASLITDHSIDYSPTYTGLPITIAFIFFFISRSITSSKTNILFLCQIMAIAIFIQLVYVVVHSFLMAFPYFYNGFGGRVAIDFHIILFLLMLFPLYLHLRNTSGKAPFDGLSALWLFPVLILAITGSWFKLDLATDHHYSIKNGKVLFFNEGHTDWNLPKFGTYGGENGGMFGMLVRDLNSRNIDVTISGISKDTLSESDILVIINLNRKLTESEKNLIWNFVKTGGSLLVLGDHTGKEIIRYPFNDLLSPVGIRFNFDSAIPRISNWKNGFKYMHHYINRGLKNENDVQIWIGASLSVTYPSVPVITGKNAFSDSGNLNDIQRGYLGDMRYNHGEKLGDIVLVAEADYGKGTVLVFGDTSPFQNSAIALSSVFVKGIFDWLFNFHEVKSHRFLPLFDSFLILALVLFASLKYWKRWNFQVYLFLPFAILFFMGFNLTKDPPREFLGHEDIALIDASHMERFSFDLWGEPDGIGGLVYNLVRNDFSPVVMRYFNTQQLDIAEVLVIIAPAKPFSSHYIKYIAEWVKNGGYLIVAVSWHERNGIQPLLEILNLSIGNTPLGRVMPFQGDPGLSFDNAWPVIFKQETGVSLSKVWEYSTVAFSQYGNGGILLIGDTSFLLNKNLEGLHNYHESNIIFLREIFATYF